MRGDGKSGFPNKIAFETLYHSSKTDYVPGLVDEFHAWMSDRFPESATGSWETLFRLLDKELLQLYKGLPKRSKDEKKKAGEKELRKGELAGSAQKLKDFFPERFHSLPSILATSSWNGNFKEFTRETFVTNDGNVVVPAGRGSKVLRGAPRAVINASFTITISLDDEMFDEIVSEAVFGPGFATICDGGLCWIEDS